MNGSTRGRLAEAQREEQLPEKALSGVQAAERDRPLQVYPVRLQAYLRDLNGTLAKAEPRARHLLQQDVERIIVHPIRGKDGEVLCQG